MSRLTLGEVRRRLRKINPLIKITDDKYVNARTKIKCVCLVDGMVWYPTWDNLRVGKGCPECANNRKRTPNNKFIKDVRKINRNVNIKSEYKNMASMMNCSCNKCGSDYIIRADSLMAGYGCPACSKRKRSKTHDLFVEEMSDINRGIAVIGNYENKRTRVKCKCTVCGRKWFALPNNLLVGSGCPDCAPMSYGEEIVSGVLDKLNLIYEREYSFDDCVNEIALRFDFYIPKLNTCIEYDGEHHFKPINYFGGEDKYKKVQKNDSIKNNYCKENGIKLIRIPYTEKDIKQSLMSQLSIL